MKKLSYILLLAVAVLASCRKHDDTLQNPQEDAWKTDLSLPVPIKFSSGNSIATKALVSEFTDMKEKIGIVGVDNTLTNLDGSYQKWTPDGNGSVLFYAEADKGSATATVTNVVTTASGEDGDIAFDGGDRYYPMYSTNNYTFYGYYPHKPLSLPSSGFTATYELGNTDILWAEAKVEDGTGYNAKYIRNNPGNLPKLNFKHLLTALEFHIVSEDPSKPVENVEIIGIKIHNTYIQGALLVASRATDPKYAAGTFMPVREGTVQGTVSLTVDEGVSIGNVGYKPGTGLKLGTMLLIPTPTAYTNSELSVSNDASTFYAEVSAKTSVDNFGKNAVSTIFPLPVPTEGEFLAGTKYKYTITVKDLEELSIKVSLIGWKDYGGEGATTGNLIMGEQ